MTTVRLENVTKRFDGVIALDAVNLEITDGENSSFCLVRLARAKQQRYGALLG